MSKFGEFLKKLEFQCTGFSLLITNETQIPSKFPQYDEQVKASSYNDLEKQVKLIYETIIEHISSENPEITVFFPLIPSKTATAIALLPDLLNSIPDAQAQAIKVVKNQTYDLSKNIKSSVARHSSGLLWIDGEVVDAKSIANQIPAVVQDIQNLQLLRVVLGKSSCVQIVFATLPSQDFCDMLFETDYPSISDLGQLLKQDSTEETVRTYFLALVAQQTAGFFSSKPIQIAELDSAVKSAETDVDADAYYLQNDAISLLVHRNLSVSTQIMYDALVWRLYPVISVLIAADQRPDDSRFKFAYWLGKSAGLGQCFAGAQQPAQSAAQALRSNQMAAFLELDLVEQVSKEVQADASVGAQLNVKQLRRQQGQQGDPVAKNDASMIVEVRETVAKRVGLRGVTAERLAEATLQLDEKRRQLLAVRDKMLGLPVQMVTYMEQQRINAELKEILKRKASEFQEQNSQLQEAIEKKKALDASVLDGSRMERRWVQEVEKLEEHYRK